ncbi:MAG TPA: serine protease [Elusimicrobia bacterium]|nr:serine protease [Elusimicrobiota bacterium]
MRRTVLLAAAAVLVPAFLSSMPVYNEDDRRDTVDVQDDQAQALADSTVALFGADQVKLRGGRASLATESYQQALQLCPGERFNDQNIGPNCSGSLVAPDLVLTAGHCIQDEASCKATAFVFGFRTRKGGATPKSVSADQVYGCAGIVGRKLEGEAGTDWAVVRLDRAVTDHKPLAVHRQDVSNGTPLTVIGYPSGLPEKIADGGAVLDASPAGFYRTNLDTFHGNSGSPVFHSQSGKIVGILVRGENDYEEVTLPDGTKCQKTKHCGPSDNCRGEDVTKVSEFAQFIPEHRRTRRASAAKSPTLDSLRKLTGGD